MIAPADRIEIETALRSLLDMETPLQPNRLTNATIIYERGAGIMLLRPAATTRRRIALVPQGVMDHHATLALSAVALGAWNMACAVRALPGAIPDAEEPQEPDLVEAPAAPDEQQRREGLLRAIEAAPILTADVDSFKRAEALVTAADEFAKFIAGTVLVPADSPDAE